MLDIGDSGAHLDNIAAIALADRYSSECLFGLSEKQAMTEAMRLGMALLHNCKSLEKEDSVDRAWHFIEGWLAENKTRFDTAVSPCYGKIERNRIYNRVRAAGDAGVRRVHLYQVHQGIP